MSSNLETVRTKVRVNLDVSMLKLHERSMSFKEIIRYLENKSEDIGYEAKMEADTVYEGDQAVSKLVAFYMRDETDEEYDQRMKDVTARVERAERNERDTLTRLLTKYFPDSVLTPRITVEEIPNSFEVTWKMHINAGDRYEAADTAMGKIVEGSALVFMVRNILKETDPKMVDLNSEK